MSLYKTRQSDLVEDALVVKALSFDKLVLSLIEVLSLTIDNK